jgi:glycosyltransferase involved in cell wall biosynthesis
MPQGLDIVTFANDWTADPTSKHHLMKRFAERNRVLWVEAAGMRTPSLNRSGDLQRLVTKARSFTRRARPVLPGLHAYSPPTIPLPGSRVASAANAALYRGSIGRELRSLGMRSDPLLWVYGPHVAPWIRGMRRQFLLYHCVDRWSAFQGYDPEVMIAGEAEICRAADLVIASAEDLAERCRQYTDNVHYVSHGVDHAHFATALEPGDLPADIANIPGPRIGFFGLIHEWVDIDLIGRLADRLPYSFVLIGATDQDLGPLTARKNVYHLGRRKYAELPDYSRGFAAAIVPFRTSELTQSVNPIKLREYAAAGLPVVSTGLPEVRRCADIAVCADGDDEWVSALQAAVERGADEAERRRQSARVLGEDWSAVVERIEGLIREAREPRRPASPVLV